MCLGIPGEVVERIEADDPGGLEEGMVAFGGIRKRVCLAYTPEAKVGDFVLVHAGFALSVIDPDEAERVFELIGQIEALGREPDEVPG
jgi:hydrogenase expression/formation protein HypC